MNDFIITTTQILDGYSVLRYLGAINVNIVLGTNFFSDFAASFTDIFGGTSETYQRKMDIMYDNAKKELTKRARIKGANAIVGFRIDFDEISGKGKSMFMLSATGTACLVEEIKAKQVIEVTDSCVDLNRLNLERKRQRLLTKLQKDNPVLNEDDYNFIAENTDKAIIGLLIAKSYYNSTDDSRAKEEAIVNQLEYNDAINIVYPLYISHIVPKYNYNGVQDGEEDVSEEYAKLIKKSNLFSPQFVLDMIPDNLQKAIKILDCDKPYYNIEDLVCMKKIIESLENLPDVGQKIVGKNGVFSKEKELYVCRNGHKNDGDTLFCQDCGENIKGLTQSDIRRIESFKKRIVMLESMM